MSNQQHESQQLGELEYVPHLGSEQVPDLGLEANMKVKKTSKQ